MADDDETKERDQAAIHEALLGVLRESKVLPDDAILTGWAISYEYQSLDDASAGVVYGPPTLKHWQAMGLLEWSRICLNESVT